MSKIRWFDCNGIEINEGDTVRNIHSGEEELVYECHPVDCPEDVSLGLNASNEDYLRLHPDCAREVYPFSDFEYLTTAVNQNCLVDYEKVVR